MKNNDQKKLKFTELGNRIRRAVEKTGKNQVEVASLLRVYPPNLTRWIQGENAPSFEYLVKIGKLTNVSFDWLLTGEGESERQRVSYPLVLEGLLPYGGVKTPERRLPENGPKRRIINKVIKILDSENKKALKALTSNIETCLVVIEKKEIEIKGGE
jgi:transcriptional regulator with XRE-family HTH domain